MHMYLYIYMHVHVAACNLFHHWVRATRPYERASDRALASLHSRPDVVVQMKRATASTGSAKPKKLRLAQRIGLNTESVGIVATSGAVGNDAKATTSSGRSSGSAAAPKVDDGPRGRAWTVTVALPGSIVDNAQTHELRTHLVGQVARACAIFNVDEIVVFSTESGPQPSIAADAAASSSGRGGKRTNGSIFMARLLQYLECPQYLRKQLFPMHPDLRSVGLVAPLDAPHHLRIDEACDYREAVVVAPGAAGGGGAARESSQGGGGGSAATEGGGGGDSQGQATSECVYTGLRKELRIGRELPVGTRVTVRMPATGSSNARAATVVPPREPREVAGLYWGFEVRLAKGLAAVWSECPFASGYDVSIGTSEHGDTRLHASGDRSGADGGSDGGSDADAAPFSLPPFRHLLIVFGGVEGLEPAVSAEDALAECEDDVPSLFDHYLNLCPGQGSRTIRTEEALLVGLAALKPHIERAGRAGVAQA